MAAAWGGREVRGGRLCCYLPALPLRCSRPLMRVSVPGPLAVAVLTTGREPSTPGGGAIAALGTKVPGSVQLALSVLQALLDGLCLPAALAAAPGPEAAAQFPEPLPLPLPRVGSAQDHALLGRLLAQRLAAGTAATLSPPLLPALAALLLPLLPPGLHAVSSTSTWQRYGSLDNKATGQMGMRAAVYYMVTTVIVVFIRILMDTIIRPGKDFKEGLHHDG